MTQQAPDSETLAGQNEPFVADASFAQQRLLVLDRLQPGRPTYNVPLAYRLTGPIDADRLCTAIGLLAARHEILRTTFTLESDRALQIIGPHASAPFRTVDLRGPDSVPGAGDLDASTRALLDRDAATPFDVAARPPWRVHLVQRPHDHVLAFAFHHLIFDGWSEDVLLTELASLYNGLGRGEPPQLPPLPVQYADYAAWQREHMQGDALAQSLAHWRQRLADAPDGLQLPLDRAWPSGPSHRGALLAHQFDAALTERLARFARGEQATLFMVLFASLAALLARLTGQTDLIAGTPHAGRDRAETHPLIGFFVNTLALRIDLGGRPSFRDAVARARTTALDAFGRPDTPFDAIIDSLKLPRRPDRLPLIDVLFALQPAIAASVSLDGARLERLDVHSGTSKCPLTVLVTPQDGALHISAEYATDILDGASVARWLHLWERLTWAALTSPDAPLDALDVLSDADRRELIVTLNPPPAATSAPISVHARFERQVDHSPDADAVFMGDRTLTYRELDRRANRLAHRLIALGVTRETPVAYLLDRSIDSVIAMLAILKSGGAYVPLDASAPAGRLRFLIVDSGAALVLTQTAHAARFVGLEGIRVAMAPDLIERDAAPIDAAEADAGDARPRAGSTPGDLACVMYTSGSTGQPKGVAVEHRQIDRLIAHADYVSLGPAETLLHLAPQAFDASTFEVWGALLTGARLVIAPDGAATPAEIQALITRHGVTTAWLTAGLFNSVIDIQPDALAGVAQLLIGGEALSLPHVRRAQETLPDLRLTNGYGPTECTTFSCVYPLPQRLDPTLASVPIGRPLADARAYVVDALGRLAPRGVIGELWMGGAGVARGYVNRPDQTADAFLPDPFTPGAAAGNPPPRVYRTGDRVRWRNDDTLEFHGRDDLQIKLRGLRIDLGEIESTLDAHPAVGAAAVVLHGPSPDRAKLVAYLAPHSTDRRHGADQASAPLPGQQLEAWLRRTLPEYMVPNVFTWVDALPLTSNGKIDRKALAARPLTVDATRRTAGEEPASGTEQTLAAIWRRLLDVPFAGRHDSFFALGGHSLLAIRLFAEIERTFGIRLPLVRLMHAPTVATLAALLDERQHGEPPGTLVALRREGVHPPLFIPPSVGGELLYARTLVAALDADRPVYGFTLPAGSEPFRDLRSMAARFVADLLTFQPQGPFHLAGYSFSAVIAFEMAQQLLQAGHEVGVLAMIDWGPGSPPSLVRRVKSVGQFAANLPMWLADDIFQSGWRQVAARVQRKLGTLTQKLRGVGRTEPEREAAVMVNDMFDSTRLPDAYRRLMQTHLEAFLRYTPQPYAGDVLLLRARSRPLFHSLEPDLGWRAYLRPGHLRVLSVRCHHDNILNTPHAASVARTLAGAMRDAESTTPRTVGSTTVLRAAIQ